jgi:large subunit ribosomal protein L10e
MSIRCRDQHKATIIEALRRARYKFPGRQKIIISKKWGFTSLDRADYEALKAQKQVINDGAYVQVSRGQSLMIGCVRC